MLRSKKLIVIVLLATVVLAGSLGGIALAQTTEDGDGQVTTLFDRIAAILTGDGVDVTSEQLQDAFIQARQECHDEAMESRLQAMVDAGKLTQEEADQYQEWFDSRPEGPMGFEHQGMAGFGHRGMGGFGGMRGYSGPHGFSLPTQ